MLDLWFLPGHCWGSEYALVCLASPLLHVNNGCTRTPLLWSKNSSHTCPSLKELSMFIRKFCSTTGNILTTRYILIRKIILKYDIMQNCKGHYDRLRQYLDLKVEIEVSPCKEVQFMALLWHHQHCIMSSTIHLWWHDDYV